MLSRREILNWLVKNINAQDNLEKYIKEIGDIYQFLKQIDLFNFTSTVSKQFVLELEDHSEPQSSIRGNSPSYKKPGSERFTEKLLFSLYMKSELWNFLNSKYISHFYLRRIRTHELDEFIYTISKNFNSFLKNISILTREDIQ